MTTDLDFSGQETVLAGVVVCVELLVVEWWPLGLRRILAVLVLSFAGDASLVVSVEELKVYWTSL